MQTEFAVTDEQIAGELGRAKRRLNMVRALVFVCAVAGIGFMVSMDGLAPEPGMRKVWLAAGGSTAMVVFTVGLMNLRGLAARVEDWSWVTKLDIEQFNESLREREVDSVRAALRSLAEKQGGRLVYWQLRVARRQVLLEGRKWVADDYGLKA